jgi:hypothetical protein
LESGFVPKAEIHFKSIKLLLSLKADVAEIKRIAALKILGDVNAWPERVKNVR